MLLNILLGLILLGMIVVLITILVDYVRAKRQNKLEKGTSLLAFSLTGSIINFFDTLGIGSFAPTTAVFKHFHLVKDKIIPGTLNVSMCIPVMLEALLFIRSVQVDPITLTAMIVAAAVGAGLGANIVSKLDERKIQITMATALLVVFLLILAGILNIMPMGGTATAFTGWKLTVAVIGNLIFGALMTVGIGLYAPCMALVYSLGMNPLVAFPIMMGSCAFLMPVASLKFIKEGLFHRRGALIIMISGAIGVVIAVYIVKSLPLKILQWLVMIVILYTSFRLYKDALENRKKHQAQKNLLG